VWLLLAGSVLTGLAHPEIPRLVVFWLLALAVLPMARTVARGVCRRRAAYRQDAIVVGAGEVGQLIARKLLNHPEYGVRVVGFVDDRPRPRHPDLPEDLTILGRPDELEDLVRRLGVDRVVMAFTGRPAIDLVGCVRRLAQCDVQVDLVPRLFEALGPRVGVHSIEGVTLLGLSPARAGATARAVKRAIDVVGASVGLLLAAPLMAFIAVRIRLDSPGPVFFRQTRVGRGMERFTLLKFRTMTVGTDDRAHREYVARTLAAERMSLEAGTNGLHKPDQAAAVTRVGRVLRRTSLDELPQLVNILRGDMSLVGPRPCIPYEIEHFAPHQLERFLLPQGLTGLWQVEARANAGMAEALDMDVAYVRSWSLGFDLWLLARTPLALLRQRSRTA
jgi:exopolysaccharide biosynthesis polyprenyl glycosylphosphotransferase